MAIVFDSDAGTITGLSVGGLPDGIVDAGTLATNSVDSAELIDGAVDDSHMAAMASSKLTGALPAISGASLTSIPAGNLTGSLPAISGASLTGITAGVTEADQWRLNTTFTGNASPISANLERCDTDFDKIGTGMTQSSGIFTFPSTGIWKVEFFVKHRAEVATDYCEMKIVVATDGSTYDTRANTQTGTSTAVRFSSGYCSTILDITSTVAKVRFDVVQANTSNKIEGHSLRNVTAFTFIKLGDT
jgi:hypothetical protein